MNLGRGHELRNEHKRNKIVGSGSLSTRKEKRCEQKFKYIFILLVTS